MHQCAVECEQRSLRLAFTEATQWLNTDKIISYSK